MANNALFEGYTIVACGTLSPELNYLKSNGFLSADKILFTTPGLHENIRELEKQLVKQVNHVNQYSQKMIVIYGSRCYNHIFLLLP